MKITSRTCSPDERVNISLEISIGWMGNHLGSRINNAMNETLGERVWATVSALGWDRSVLAEGHTWVESMFLKERKLTVFIANAVAMRKQVSVLFSRRASPSDNFRVMN